MSRLRFASLFIITVVVAGVVGYRFLEEYTWLESLYMTVSVQIGRASCRERV